MSETFFFGEADELLADTLCNAPHRSRNAFGECSLFVERFRIAKGCLNSLLDALLSEGDDRPISLYDDMCADDSCHLF